MKIILNSTVLYIFSFVSFLDIRFEVKQDLILVRTQ